jgi:hypothetical protein
MIEISNQQVHLDKPHMCLTPRIELAGKQTCTSLSDFEATIAALYEQMSAAVEISFDVKGRLLTASHQPPSTGEAHYHLQYSLTQSTVAITASVDTASQSPLRFVLPVISSSTEATAQPDPRTIQITKPKGTLTIRTQAAQGFDPIPKERTFNLVPGFECVPLAITMQPAERVTIHLEASPNQ